MIYQEVNFKFLTPTCESGDLFIDCNIAQLSPHTKIGEGVSNLSFTGCNCLNCDLPVGSTVIDCLNIHKSLCSHLHPAIGLTPCADDCSHVVSTDPYVYEDTLVS